MFATYIGHPFFVKVHFSNISCGSVFDCSDFCLTNMFGSKDAKAKAALKAKLRRMCEIKTKGKCNVPMWVHEMWKSGNHLQMALDLQAANFDKARTNPPGSNAEILFDT